MLQILKCVFFSFFIVNSAYALSCIDNKDTYTAYDNTVPHEEINNIASEYYVLSYSWAPNHCSRIPEANKRPGKKDYLQCGSDRKFGYILHGLWPQGALNGTGNYPRACEGEQKKIARGLLEKYLCMTPSVWLLQHEYEFHGTCMHDEELEEPRTYFDIALKLHNQMQLPEQQLANTAQSIDWFLQNNPHLKKSAIQYYKRHKEWQFCFDTNFKVMSCPSKATSQNLTEQCKIKGNISSNSGKKTYFVATHRDYASVVISPTKNERCFNTENEALAAGWRKAR